MPTAADIVKELQAIRVAALEMAKRASTLEKKLAPVQGPASKPKKVDPMERAIARSNRTLQRKNLHI